MKVKSICLLFLIIFSSCNKEDCHTIREKNIIDGQYYFYFNTPLNDGPGYSSVDDLNSSGYIPDRYASGIVDKDTYDSTNIGDKYCE